MEPALAPRGRSAAMTAERRSARCKPAVVRSRQAHQAASHIPDVAALIRATGRAWCESARVGCLELATRAPLAPPLPARGERSDSERSEGIRVRGRSRESELVDKPPHPICFTSQGLRSQIDLSRKRGEVEQAARALPPPSNEPYAIALHHAGRVCVPGLGGVGRRPGRPAPVRLVDSRQPAVFCLASGCARFGSGCDRTLGRIPPLPLLAHDPEKWVPVFGKDHAPSAS